MNQFKILIKGFALLGIFGLLMSCGGGSSNPPAPEPMVLVGGLGVGTGGIDGGDLYVLDTETGEVLGFVDTVADCGGPCEIGRISSSVYHSASQSLIVGLGNSNFCSACVVQIDLSTGIGTVLWDNMTLQGAVGMAFTVDAVPGMSMDASGTIYAILKRSAGGPVGLVSFTTTTSPAFIGLTGVAASLMRTNDLGNGLNFASDGTLHYTTGGGLSTIDTSTGVATNLGDLIYSGLMVGGDPDFTKIDSMTLTPSGNLAGILDDRNLNSRYFGTLDTTTRTFATTAFYAGASIEATYLSVVVKLDGLAAIPESFVTSVLLPLP